MLQLFRSRKAAPVDEEPRPTGFSVDEGALLDEFIEWGQAVCPLLQSADAEDFDTLLRGVTQIRRALRDPEHSVRPAVRVEVMEVLRREGLDQHGFDALRMIAAMRQILRRAVIARTPVVSPVVSPVTAASQDGMAPATSASEDAQRIAQLERQINEMQQHNAALQEIIDHLSHHG
jgi:hypothetical protein